MAQNSRRPLHPKGDFFDLKGTGSNVNTEIVAGLTTFFTMAYIIFVNPGILAAAGIPESAVLMATLLLRLSVRSYGLLGQLCLCSGLRYGLECVLYVYRLRFAWAFPGRQLWLVFLCGY